ncbi:MAG TPA: flagellar basal-body MS-ring/collar protein FliF [Sphingomonas sp.]|jgi:flagellar M-ring protein FliF|uniref:flagellar basal-body MS-ring/collar protein FliF n=1 Tax=Sphingomonas sp. TaxID=28214 RepID=UPI002ED95AD1
MSELVATPTDVRTMPMPARIPSTSGFGSVLERIRSFAGQPAVAKAMPAVGLLAMIGLAFLIWSSFSAAPQRDLFRGLPDGDKAAVADALQTAGIQYTIDRSTGALTVPDDKYYEAKMLLAQAGLPKSAPDGESAMASLPLGASRAVEGERLRAAHELDLARTIEAIDAVQTAKVHIAVEQPSVFLRDQRPGQASVMLKLNGGRSLSEAQVQAIANLVASSVPGLTPDAVSIVDQSGRLLSKAGQDPGAQVADRQIAIQNQVEQRYADALDKLLTPLVGAGNFTAEVHADLDFAEVQATRESYPKELQAVRAEQGGWTKEGGPQGLASGIPGALSNTPPSAATVSTAPNQTVAAPPAAGTTAAAGALTGEAARTTENYNRTFELGREVSVTKNPAGTVRRLSVAVALKDEKGAKRSPAEIAALEKLVQGAVGYDQRRGDVIALSSRSFASIDAEKLPWYEASWIPMASRNLSAVLIALLVVFGVARPLLKRRATPAAAPAAKGDAAKSGGKAGVPAVTSGGGSGSMGNEIASALAANGALSAPVTLEMIESAPSYSARADLIRNFVKQDPARAALVVRDLIRQDAAEEVGANG